MKFITLFIFITLYANLSQQIIQLIKCPEGLVPVKNPEQTCARVTCVSDQKFNMVGCSEYRCEPGKQIGFKDVDYTKPYPDCCGGPICQE